MTALLLLTLGAALTLLTLTLISPYLPRRQNFAARNLPTSAGLSFLPIMLTVLAAYLAGWVGLGEAGAWYLVYSLVAGVVGFADDGWGGAGERGVAGHLRA